MTVRKGYGTLLQEALFDMNTIDFKWYFEKFNGKYKNKWEIVKDVKFDTYSGHSSYREDGSDIHYEPSKLVLHSKTFGNWAIPITEVKKMFENQGKLMVIQTSLF